MASGVTLPALLFKHLNLGVSVMLRHCSQDLCFVAAEAAKANESQPKHHTHNEDEEATSYQKKGKACTQLSWAEKNNAYRTILSSRDATPLRAVAKGPVKYIKTARRGMQGKAWEWVYARLAMNTACATQQEQMVPEQGLANGSPLRAPN